MIQVVITGHGNFASGIKSMLNMVIGEVEQGFFIDFSDDLTSEDLHKQFSTLIAEAKGQIIFLCDLAGGTPFNQACLAMHSQGYSSGVIGGINIPLILEVLDLRENQSDLLTLSLQAKESALEAMMVFGQLKTTSAKNSLSDDEGGI